MGKNFRETLNERKKDPTFLAEWETQAPERQTMCAIAEAREENAMKQKRKAEMADTKE